MTSATMPPSARSGVRECLTWGSGCIGLRDPTRGLPGFTAPCRMTFFASFLHPFFKCMLEHILHRCWSQLGVQNRANLGPCWPLLSIFSGVHLEISPSAPYPIIYNTKWPSGHAKSGAKSIKNRSKRASKSIRTVIEKIVEMGIDF